MTKSFLPPAGSDPPRLSVESLEERLRALPPAEVPAALSARLVAAIPVVKSGGASAVSAKRRWPWVVGIVALCMASSAVWYSIAVHWKSGPVVGVNDVDASGVVSNDGRAPSKAVEDAEQAVRVDPYDADAWFRLAKAQADARRPDVAMGSAQKAIDVARSRNRADFVATVETWLRGYRAAESQRAAP